MVDPNDPKIETQASRVFEKFGGASALFCSLRSQHSEQFKDISAIYRWRLPKSKGGTDGLIPTRAIPHVMLAARLDGIILTPDDLFPRTLLSDNPISLPPVTWSEKNVPAAPISTGGLETLFPKFNVHRLGAGPVLEAVELGEHVINDVVRAGKVCAESLLLLHGFGRHLSVVRRHIAAQKIVGTVDMLKQDVADGLTSKIIIYAADGAIVSELRYRLKNLGALSIHDSTDSKGIEVAVHRFSRTEMCQVLCCQLGELGARHDFTSAQEVVFADAAWDPRINAAAVMRVHRLGQREPVRVRFVGLARTLDAQFQRTLKHHTRQIVSGFGNGSEEHESEKP